MSKTDLCPLAIATAEHIRDSQKLSFAEQVAIVAAVQLMCEHWHKKGLQELRIEFCSRFGAKAAGVIQAQKTTE